jgi:positive regulator of sigma E activity
VTARAGVAFAAGLVAALLACAEALACPSCATREGPGTNVLALVGAMIAVPYVVSVLVIRAVRRLGRESDG